MDGHGPGPGNMDGHGPGNGPGHGPGPGHGHGQTIHVLKKFGPSPSGFIYIYIYIREFLFCFVVRILCKNPFAKRRSAIG